MSGTTTGTPSTFSTQKTRLFILILTAISFFLIIPLASSASSINFTFSSPAESNAEEEIAITITPISYNSSMSYDVKAWVNDDVIASSELYDIISEKWRSPQTYIPSVFPEHLSFKVKSHYVGNTSICVRLRQNSPQTTYPEVCNPINITPALVQNNTNSTEDTGNKTNSTNTSTKSNKNHASSNSSKSSLNNSSNSSSSPPPQSDTSPPATGKIILGKTQQGQSDSQSSPQIFRTSEERFHLYLVYGFTILCAVLVILLAFRFL